MAQMNPDEEIIATNQQIRDLQNTITKLNNYRYKRLVYNLVKKGHVEMNNMVEASGYSQSMIYNIIDEFDKKTTEDGSTEI